MQHTVAAEARLLQLLGFQAEHMISPVSRAAWPCFCFCPCPACCNTEYFCICGVPVALPYHLCTFHIRPASGVPEAYGLGRGANPGTGRNGHLE